MIKKYIVIFFLIFVQIKSNGIYPRELDLSGVRLGDFLAEISQYSNYTILGETGASDIIIDFYLKENMKISEILKILEKAYYLRMEKTENYIIMRSRKNNSENILVGKIFAHGRPIEGAKVILKNSVEYELETGSNGEYIIDGIPIGSYLIGVEAENYNYPGDLIDIEKGVNKKDINLDPIKGKRYVNSGEKIEQIYGESDIIKNIQLENIDSKEVKQILEKIHEDKLKVAKSKRNNSVILTGKTKHYLEALKLIKELDRAEKQIRASAEVIEVKENTFEDVGFNWNYYHDRADGSSLDDGLSADLLGSGYIDGIGNVLGSTINFVGNFNRMKDVIDINLALLESTQELKTRAKQSIMIVNKEEGTFKMVSEVIVGEEIEENTDTNETISTPIFKEAGIILKVKPDIKSNNNIYLDISLEVSDFRLRRTFDKDEENSGTFNAEGGSKDSRSIKTKVRIKSGETILIGGLKKRVNHQLNSQVPGISRVPVVGNLFKSKSGKEEYMDIYIKLNAEIIKES